MTILMTRTAFAILSIIVSVTFVFADSADSLVYDSLRMHVAAIDSSHPALSTAAALAEAGLFTDAISILHEHAQVDSVTPTTGSHNLQHPIQWRISTGIDYYHLEDIDTVAMTTEELRDYKRLTETPLSMWMRVKTIIQPGVAFVADVTPEAYISERKGRLSVLARSPLLGGILYVEPTIKAEKWFHAGAGDTTFAPAHKQPSDMGGLAMLLTASNQNLSPGPIMWSIPIAVDWEHYRENQPGYESLVKYDFSPSFEIQPEMSSIGARLSTQARYENYYRTSSDQLDVARFSGHLEGFNRNEKYYTLLNATWMGDWYTHATTPQVINRFEGGSRFSYKATDFLSGHFRLHGIHEWEKYSDSHKSTLFTARGSELIVEPSIETTIGAYVMVIPELLFEQRWAGRHGDHSIWDTQRTFEPGLRFRWSSTILDASVRGAFRSEKIDSHSIGTADNSRSFRAAADANLNLSRQLSVNIVTDYQYRMYLNKRVSENISLSATATIRL
jgi:hypothetical protein